MKVIRSFNLFRKVSGKYLKAICAMLYWLFISFSGIAQSGSATVSGTVTSPDGEGLPGVTIAVKDFNLGTVTDAEGNFKLNVPEGAKTLVISFIGYATQEVSINGQSNITVSLVEDVTTLSEVVVIAYGNTTLRNSVGAVQSVNSKELQDIPAPQVTQKLQGKWQARTGDASAYQRISFYFYLFKSIICGRRISNHRRYQSY
jgi:TonB-dependent starch-binding outer membrane protein SusC